MVSPLRLVSIYALASPRLHGFLIINISMLHKWISKTPNPNYHKQHIPLGRHKWHTCVIHTDPIRQFTVMHLLTKTQQSDELTVLLAKVTASHEYLHPHTSRGQEKTSSIHENTTKNNNQFEGCDAHLSSSRRTEQFASFFLVAWRKSCKLCQMWSGITNKDTASWIHYF